MIVYSRIPICFCVRKFSFQYYQSKFLNKSCGCFVNRSLTNSYVTDKTYTINLSKPNHSKPRFQGPGLKEFLQQQNENIETTLPNIPYVSDLQWHGKQRKVYFEVYGCQMNVNDTEVVMAILQKAGFQKTENIKEADVILLVTCAIRESAESKVWNKLTLLKNMKMVRNAKKHVKIGLLGCMAERLKHKIIEKENLVDIVAGPDAYKDLPRLLALTENNQEAVNVLLSLDETYADITPVRLNQDSVSAFVSIMRGCDNMCSYCIVPFTRGRERSRPISSIVNEVQHLADQGVKEVTLLGQNVNSYRDTSESNYYGVLESKEETNLAKGFKTVYKKKKGGLRFADLLDKISVMVPEMRIRFTSPHPKDFPDEVLHLISERENICNHLHLPAQSGNSVILERMRRGYTRESYLELINHVREIIPNVTLSSDFICGFCGETEEQFQDTISLLEEVKYNVAFLFKYSCREKTTAHRRYEDDVPIDVKAERLIRMIDVYRMEVLKLNLLEVGNTHLILVEEKSKRSDNDFVGRNDGNIRVVIPSLQVPVEERETETRSIQAGDYVAVKITSASSQVLKGVPIYHSSISDFSKRRKICQGDIAQKVNIIC